VKILIVEDNMDLQTIYKELFETAGHTVRVSNDGLAGITDAVDFKPDVVLLDILMPEMDGMEFLQALRENTSISPVVIVCSNLSEQIDIDRALGAGAHYYLRKSDYVGADLLKAVEKLYGEHAGAKPGGAL
jgi:DNA-binding response OmpR family regulator